jgi:cytochrome c oxidase assembly protein subunit 11
MTDPVLRKANRSLVVKLLAMAVGSFGFGFALVPLYDVLCEVTGLNGKTGQVSAQSVESARVDTSRWVTIEFTGSVNSGLPWEFRPTVKRVRVHPGQVAEASYFARNLSGESITGQAVPSVTPRSAAAHFKKIECFCFNRQELQPKEGKEMPLRYIVQPDLPPDVQTITLSYTFFNADQKSAAKYDGQSEALAVHEHPHEHDHAVGAHGG